MFSSPSKTKSDVFLHQLVPTIFNQNYHDIHLSVFNSTLRASFMSCQKGTAGPDCLWGLSLTDYCIYSIL